jgi:hypothetical protein
LPWLPWNINNPHPQLSKAHLTTLNLNNFKVTEALGLKKILHRGPLKSHYFCTKFHENLSSSSEVISGGHRDRQTCDLISLLSFLERRLKIQKILGSNLSLETGYPEDFHKYF